MWVIYKGKKKVIWLTTLVARKSKSMALASTQLEEGYVLPHNIAKKKKKSQEGACKDSKTRGEASQLILVVPHSVLQERSFTLTRQY